MNLLYYPNNNLLTVCTEVELPIDKKYWSYIDQMKKILKKHNGKGLAANQVGILKRFFIMEYKERIIALFNPIIKSQWGSNIKKDEYCLSFKDIKFCPFRWDNISCEYFDIFGKKNLREFSGFDAQCVQHEIDHLNGKNFYEIR